MRDRSAADDPLGGPAAGWHSAPRLTHSLRPQDLHPLHAAGEGQTDKPQEPRCWVGMAGSQTGPGPALQQPLECPALIRSPRGEHRAPPAASEAPGADPSPAMAASHWPCLREEAHSAFCVSSKLSFQTGLETTQNSRKFRSGVWKTAGRGRGKARHAAGL